jgi:hypothetical protein
MPTVDSHCISRRQTSAQAALSGCQNASIVRPHGRRTLTDRLVLAASVLTWLAAARAAPADGITAFSYSNPLDFSYDQGQTAVRSEIRDPCIIATATRPA